VNGCTGHDLRLGDRVVAAEHDRDGVGGQHDLDRLLDRAVRALGIGRDDRIARGANRVPGRSETRSSVGAPTTATSASSSSAGSWVYGAPPKLSRPA
jgi:hypothetical protein